MATAAGAASDLGVSVNYTDAAFDAFCQVRTPRDGASRTVQDDLIPLVQALIADAVPLVITMVLTCFLCCYFTSTFTSWRCVGGRRVLRKMDIRRDALKVFGPPGVPVREAPTTAGGCSFAIVLAIAIVKVTLDFNNGIGLDACESSVWPVGSHYSSSDGGVGIAAAVQHVRLQYVLELLGTPDEVCTQFPVGSSSPLLQHFAPGYQIVACGNVHGYGTSLRELFLLAVLDVRTTSVVVRSPWPISFTAMNDPVTLRPQYMLSNTCLDTALLKAQFPGVSNMKVCSTITRFSKYTSRKNGPSSSSYAVKDLAATTISGVRDRNSSANVESGWSFTSDTMPPEEGVVFSRQHSLCSSLFMDTEGYGPFSYAVERQVEVGGNGAASGHVPGAVPGLYTDIYVNDMTSGGDDTRGVAASFQCRSGLGLGVPPTAAPAALKAALVNSTEWVRDPSTADGTIAERFYTKSDAGAQIFPACARANNASDPSASRIHRFVLGVPGGALRDASSVRSVVSKCPGYGGVLLSALSGAGGLLVFHPLLRLALLYLRRRAAFPSTQRKLARREKSSGSVLQMFSDLKTAAKAGAEHAREARRRHMAASGETVSLLSACRSRAGTCRVHPILRATLVSVFSVAMLWTMMTSSFLVSLSNSTAHGLGSAGETSLVNVLALLAMLTMLCVICNACLAAVLLWIPSAYLLLRDPRQSGCIRGVVAFVVLCALVLLTINALSVLSDREWVIDAGWLIARFPSAVWCGVVFGLCCMACTRPCRGRCLYVAPQPKSARAGKGSDAEAVVDVEQQGESDTPESESSDSDVARAFLGAVGDNTGEGPRASGRLGGGHGGDSGGAESPAPRLSRGSRAAAAGGGQQVSSTADADRDPRQPRAIGDAPRYPGRARADRRPRRSKPCCSDLRESVSDVCTHLKHVFLGRQDDHEEFGGSDDDYAYGGGVGAGRRTTRRKSNPMRGVQMTRR